MKFMSTSYPSYPTQNRNCTKNKVVNIKNKGNSGSIKKKKNAYDANVLKRWGEITNSAPDGFTRQFYTFVETIPKSNGQKIMPLPYCNPIFCQLQRDIEM